MKFVHDGIRSHLLGELPDVLTPLRHVSLDYVQSRQAEVKEFERLRRNRFSVGYFRYGHNFEVVEPGNYQNVESAIQRLQRYLIDGNQEHLVDAANLCAVEFINPASHPNPHFSPSDDVTHVEACR